MGARRRHRHRRAHASGAHGRRLFTLGFEDCATALRERRAAGDGVLRRAVSSLQRADAFSVNPDRIHFASDGVHLAIERPCQPAPGDDARSRSACVLLDGVGACREVSLPADEQRMVGMNGARLLLAGCAEGGCEATVVDGAWRSASRIGLPCGVLLRAGGESGGLRLVSGGAARDLDAELPPHEGL